MHDTTTLKLRAKILGLCRIKMDPSNNSGGAFSTIKPILQPPPPEITLATQNARGLNDTQKAARLFNTILNNTKTDILLLQETYLSPDKQSNITKIWQSLGGGETRFASSGSTNSRGSAIFLKKWIKASNITRFLPTTDGRTTLLDLSFLDFKIRVINIYAPNDPTVRRSYFANLSFWLRTNPFLTQNVIIGGDFNMVEDVTTDRTSYNTNVKSYDSYQSTKGSFELQIMTQNLNLQDAWRCKNSSAKQFTWRSPGDRCQVRLDRFYSPKHLTRTSDTNFLNHGLSDHDLVTLQIRTLSKKVNLPGPGYWKFNTSLLSNENYISLINETIDNLSKRGNPSIIWERCKLHIQSVSQAFSKDLAFQKRKVLKEAQSQLDRLIQNNSTDHEEVNRLRSVIRNEIKHRNNSFFLHAKVEEIEYGEEPSVFFFQKMRQHKSKSTIQELKIQNNTTNDDYEILSHIHKYYKELYTNSTNDELKQLQLLDNIQTKLTEANIDILEADPTIDQLENSMKNMPNRRSPGSDGIPVEFYKTFWPKIGPLLLDVTLFSLNGSNILPTTLRRAYVTLVYKKGERNDLSNWRPISLLNVDYKIIAKTLANRLQMTVDGIISSDQTACIPGRTIEDNLFTLRDAIHYSQTHKEGFICLSVDQEKAFDRVDHPFLKRVMEKFGFGPKFIKWIETLYSNRTGHFLNNGHRTLLVSMLRGLLQGCPLSMFLYIIYSEPLSCLIRAQLSINGIPLPIPLKQFSPNTPKNTLQLLLSAYADDTTIYIKTGLGSVSGLEKTFQILQDFEKATGAKFNTQKTSACFFGVSPRSLSAGFPKTRFKLNWKDSCEEGIKILGITWYNDIDKTCKTNYDTLYDKVHSRLNLLSIRNLSIKGRALVLNTLALSKMWYTATVLPMPKPFAAKMEARMAFFIWKDKGHYLNRYTLNKPLNEGGLNVKNCKLQAIALTAKQINVIITENNNPPWAPFARMWTQKELKQLQPHTNFLNCYANIATSSPFLNIRSVPPKWYKNMCKVANENSELFRRQNELPTCKIIYTTLLNKTLKHEQQDTAFNNKACRKWEYHIPRHPIFWNHIWSTSFIGYNKNLQQEKLFKARHHILKTGENMNRPPKCRYCAHLKRPTVPMEDHMHLGVTCPFAKSVWDLYEPLISTIMGKPINSLSHVDIFLGNFKNSNPLVITIISTIVHFIWITRNEHKHENKIPNLKAIDRQIKSSLRETITLHYLINKKNHTLDTFEKCFSTGHVLCTLRGDRSLEIII